MLCFTEKHSRKPETARPETAFPTSLLARERRGPPASGAACGTGTSRVPEHHRHAAPEAARHLINAVVGLISSECVTPRQARAAAAAHGSGRPGLNIHETGGGRAPSSGGASAPRPGRAAPGKPQQRRAGAAEIALPYPRAELTGGCTSPPPQHRARAAPGAAASRGMSSSSVNSPSRGRGAQPALGITGRVPAARHHPRLPRDTEWLQEATLRLALEEEEEEESREVGGQTRQPGRAGEHPGSGRTGMGWIPA